MTRERLDRVKDFLGGGGSICPFAKSYLSRIGFNDVPEPYTEDIIKYPVVNLVTRSDLMAAVYVFDAEMPTHEQERSRSIRFFGDLFKVILLEERGEAAREYFGQLERELGIGFSPSFPMRPHLGYKGQPLFTIAMGPLYAETHPRWSPCSMMVLTREDDVVSTNQGPKDVIRRLMKERTGRLYDANELYVRPE